jgi:3-deoxy-D-manno-octulosonic-acid transferase
MGNVKFDEIRGDSGLTPGDIGFRDSQLLWVAGSTHPGEEEIILKIFTSLKGEFEDVHLVIAPRHIERTSDIMALIRQYGFLPVAFSKISEHRIAPNSVVVLDTIGHLRSLYSLAQLVFVGKSLTSHGGQNIIEPASFGKPILIGPFTENFRDIVDIFLQEKAIVQVRDADELSSKTIELFKNPRERERLGRFAKDVVQKNQGATQKTFEVIKRILVET